MNILLIHQNFPGQYKHLARVLAGNPANKVIAIGDKRNVHPQGKQLGYALYGLDIPNEQTSHPLLKSTEQNLARGLAVQRILVRLREQGFRPDLVLGHTGWGDCLFVKDVFPDCCFVGFLEFFYNMQGADLGFDPEFPPSEHAAGRLRIRNMTQLATLPGMDAAVSPTRWQASQYPDFYRERIRVIHDGVDTRLLTPAGADPLGFSLGAKGLRLSAADEIVTFVNRNLEPYRGFHSFMRSLPEFLRRRPRAHVFLVGGDQVSYGSPPANGGTWKEVMLAELQGELDLSRVHFLGKLAYQDYVRLLQASTVHVYLTYPFVLSWSMLEAMALGCMVIGSDTAPVREVVQHDTNGWLCDFFNHQLLAEMMDEAVRSRESLRPLRRAARATVVEHYDLTSCTLPAYKTFLQELVGS